MQGIKRKIVFVTLYEGLAIVFSSAGMAMVTEQPLALAGTVAVVASTFAVLWNLLFNTLFEAWESRQADRTRSFWRRVAHAIGFEGGMIAFMVPVFSFSFGVSLVQAFVMQLGLLAFFLIYTFLFNLAFDKIFGLPQSAIADPPVA